MACRREPKRHAAAPLDIVSQSTMHAILSLACQFLLVPRYLSIVRLSPTVHLEQDMAHTITKCDRTGRRLLVLRPNGVVLSGAATMNESAGSMAEPPPAQSGEMFNRPTDACVCPHTGEIFVADGYGNSRCATRHSISVQVLRHSVAMRVIVV